MFHILQKIWFPNIENIEIFKSGGIDKLLGRFLKDGAETLAKHISEILQPLNHCEVFPNPLQSCKTQAYFQEKKKSRPIKLHAYLVTAINFKKS